ncbi:hypothetical protein FBEOM_872 [Fusarium beomiforme]|uniref:Uncharacterized protein n=1 Tax=Fusarium beomiforme TaxID=44412 RepID=A0A9P5AV09_9HYPO|nr:hypothetical protein FBEOM_872 [Fusarium beomiforme]
MKIFLVILLLVFPTTSFSLSKRGCATWNPSPHDGWTTTGPPIRVSRTINCTAERAKENGHGKDNCKGQQYKMGIIANATINATQVTDTNVTYPYHGNTSIKNKETIIQLVRRNVNLRYLEEINLNRLTVLPFTTPANTTKNGTYGYWALVPSRYCCRGYLEDCDDELEEDLNEYPVTVCGFRIQSHGENESSTTYHGKNTFVELDEEDSVTIY